MPKQPMPELPRQHPDHPLKLKGGIDPDTGKYYLHGAAFINKKQFTVCLNFDDMPTQADTDEFIGNCGLAYQRALDKETANASLAPP